MNNDELVQGQITAMQEVLVAIISTLSQTQASLAAARLDAAIESHQSRDTDDQVRARTVQVRDAVMESYHRLLESIGSSDL